MVKNSCDMLNIYDIAGIIHTTPAYARSLVKCGLLKAEKTGEIMVSLNELVRFLVENTGMDYTDPFDPKPLFNN